ncbi:MAG TPA: hypothetical protein VGN69_10095 [Solirubrobacteraceae bacterium]|jgi:hypothetical protein|nr:hypothetical protein [Solirubrobacteraceae bacterium]
MAAAGARVVVSTRSLRRLRLSLNLTRWILYAVAAAGILASLRLALTPPSRPLAIAPRPVDDLGTRAFGALFARRYLTWDVTLPEEHRRGLAMFVGGAQDPDLGLRLPLRGRQTVGWTEVVQDRTDSPGRHVLTVAVETDPGGLVYLSVPVVRTAQRRLKLGGLPALVGPPAFTPLRGDLEGSLTDVSDAPLEAVVNRALSNYLSRSATNLASDLAPGARPSSPRAPLSVQRSVSLKWAPDGRSVIAVVQAADARGTGYTLRYAIDVRRVQARWEIFAIQSDPAA